MKNPFIKPTTVVLLMAFFAMIWTQFSEAAAGRILFVNGEVSIQDNAGKSHKGQKGGEVNEGDSIITSANGFAQIRMEDGGAVSVRPDSHFSISQFHFNGKADGTEKSSFSLVNGSVRTITGAIGKTHRENYKIETATATIGVRGTGADIGHSATIGTAVHTLFGSHTVTSVVDGKSVSLITQPGQTAFVSFGAAPKLIPAFPFSTANASQGGGAKESKAESKATSQSQPEGEKAKAEKPTSAETPATKTTSAGENSSTNASSTNNQTETSSSATVTSESKATSIQPTATSQDTAAVSTSSSSTATLSSGSSTAGITSSALSTSLTQPTTTISSTSGLTSSLNAIPIVTQIATANNVNLSSTAAVQNVASSLAIYQVMSGGTINTGQALAPPSSLWLNASSSPWVTFSGGVTSTGLSWGGQKSGQTFVYGDPCDMCAIGLNDYVRSISLSPGAALTLYQDAAYNYYYYYYYPQGGWTRVILNDTMSTLSYGFDYPNPKSWDASSFELGMAPQYYLYGASQNLVVPSNVSLLASDGASTFVSAMVDRSQFNAVLASTPTSLKFTASTADASTYEVGSDSTVIWGRWSNYSLSTNLVNVPTSGALHAIYASDLTTLSQLSALSTSATDVTYGNLVTTSHTSNEAGGMGTVTSAQAVVNFSQNVISINLSGTDTALQAGLGSYTAFGKAKIDNFTSGTMGLLGSSTPSSPPTSSVSTAATPNDISGVIHGGFVGSDARALISVFSLRNLAGNSESGTLYLKK